MCGCLSSCVGEGGFGSDVGEMEPRAEPLASGFVKIHYSSACKRGRAFA